MLYKDFIDDIESSNHNDWLYDDELGLYIFKGNINISILSDREWVLEGDDQYFHEEWAENNPDPRAYRKRFYLRYRGNIIETVYGAYVDGMRCFIPIPRISDMTISKFQYSVGEIINNCINVMNNYDDYLRRAGIQVR